MKFIHRQQASICPIFHSISLPRAPLTGSVGIPSRYCHNKVEGKEGIDGCNEREGGGGRHRLTAMPARSCRSARLFSVQLHKNISSNTEPLTRINSFSPRLRATAARRSAAAREKDRNSWGARREGREGAAGGKRGDSEARVG